MNVHLKSESITITNKSHFICSTLLIMNFGNCILYLESQKKRSSIYLDIYEHEFESSIQIVIEISMGWKDEKKVSGILGTPVVFCIRTEVQSRYSLHTHICVCFSYLKALKQCDIPPKYAISNGLDIGYISPYNNNEINVVLAVMISCDRVLYYVFKYLSKGCYK